MNRFEDCAYWYEDFSAMTDEQIKQLLKRAHQKALSCLYLNSETQMIIYSDSATGNPER
jgi:hypothetical protein